MAADGKAVVISDRFFDGLGVCLAVVLVRHRTACDDFTEKISQRI